MSNILKRTQHGMDNSDGGGEGPFLVIIDFLVERNRTEWCGGEETRPVENFIRLCCAGLRGGR